MSATIIDTETTDTTDALEVIELATMGPLTTPLSDAPVECLNFKPTKPISLGAMAVHHIIMDDLIGYPAWSVDAWTLPAGTAYVIGHNVDFDWRAVGERYRSRFAHCSGEKNSNAKLTDDDVRIIRNSEGTSKQIAPIFGISSSVVRDIRAGKRWKHVA